MNIVLIFSADFRGRYHMLCLKERQSITPIAVAFVFLH